MKQGLWKRIVNVVVVCLGFVAIYFGAATAEHDEGNGTSVPNFSHMEPRKTFTKEETVHVVYVGNSLLQVPGIPDKVTTYAENSGYHFENHSYLVSGGTLEKSLKRVALLDTMKQDLLDADVLVLQEYGNDYDTTYAHLCGLFTFSMISGQDCVKYPLADDEKLMEYMKGDSIEEKRACFDEMYMIVDSIAGYYEEAVKGWK